MKMKLLRRCAGLLALCMMLGHCALPVWAAEDEEKLTKTCKRVESIICGMQLKGRSLGYLIKQAFQNISPFETGNEEILNISRRNILISDFIRWFPFWWWWTE